MVERRLAAFGMGLVALMQLVFVVTGGDRGATYVGINAVAFAATAFMAWGLAQPRSAGLLAGIGGGFALLALVRVVNVVLDLTRIAFPISMLMFAGWALTAVAFVLWAADARRPRDALARAGLYLTGAAYFLAAMTSLSRLTPLLAITAGTVGLLIAAPNVTASRDG